MSEDIRTDRIVASFEFDRLIPSCYDAYRPLVKDAVGFFLNRLPERRRRAVFAELDALASDVPAEVRLVHFLGTFPTLHKLGQVIARHELLDAALKQQLQRLEHADSAFGVEHAVRVVKRELGESINKYSVNLDSKSIVTGSVAAVLRCQWQRPGKKRVHHAVLKVLKPGIEKHVAAELAIFEDLTEYLDAQRRNYDLPSFEYRQILETVRDLLLQETRLDAEQVHLQHAGRFYKATETVRIPKKLPFSTPRVTAMEHMDGAKVTEMLAPSGGNQPVSATELASRVLDLLISKVVFSRSDDALFHADPHAGNIFALKDGTLAILDWALVGILTKNQREQLAAMMWAALRLDSRGVTKAVTSLATEIRDKKSLASVVEKAVNKVRRGRLPGPTWMAELFDGLLSGGVRFPADLLLFRKTIFTVKGVIFDLDPNFSIDRHFFRSFLSLLLIEAPRRLRVLPFSKNFRTQLSNLDLLRTYLGSPLALARYARIAPI